MPRTAVALLVLALLSSGCAPLRSGVDDVARAADNIAVIAERANVGAAEARSQVDDAARVHGQASDAVARTLAETGVPSHDQWSTVRRHFADNAQEAAVDAVCSAVGDYLIKGEATRDDLIETLVSSLISAFWTTLP